MSIITIINIITLMTKQSDLTNLSSTKINIQTDL